MDRMNRPRAYSSNIGLCLVISIDWEFRTALLYDELTDTDPEYSFDELQFLWPTGLKDKDGQEIYEGDICLFIDCYTDEGGTYETEYMAIVKWIEEKASFMYAFYPSDFELIFMDDNTEMEVIGNIYENPELLED